MQEFDYDLFVIGAGSGGVRAARIAASHGARVAIAEEYRVGGTCVIRGCVPKKILVYASRFADDFEDAAGFGWSLERPKFDWPTLIAAKDNELARLEGAYRATLDKFHVELVMERATVSGPNEVKLAQSGRIVSAKIILIATGGRPNIDPKLPGIEHVITSNEAFHLKEMPRRVVIAGGGYIAVEFASIFNGLGADVTLIYRGGKILRGFDEDLRDALTAAMTKRGIRIVASQVFTKIEKTGGGLVGYSTTGEALTADAIMFAIGRSPNTAGLGLEAAGVKLDGEGAVVVDGASQSSVPSIYAVGDVTNRVNLTPVAIREGHAFADTVFGNKHWSVDYSTIPTAVFATPEIGTVGFTEHEARAQFGEVDIYKGSFRPMKAILAGRDERMLMKLIVERKSDRVVGVHVFGPDAAEIVQMAAIALRMGATKADFDQTMALHPSAGEELVTLREKWVAPGEAAG
ncbi:glutathione-disulfide reductase [Hyphomicrobium sp.]|jgi:glutathione reductase (NADPH)|uniref:glutathione-disulfide reductase n=1 Tax=Hyphomicrobium sp. TaxID=82 RepID=UPI002CE552C5|nr:glutathione-disulfide reductase [Hyphomicrobium sp.]HVZ05201.1 glutathione-disulfide reductase [Hyphomicrobium sp.]